MKKSAFIIAADKSGSGKTTITTGLLYTLKTKGYSLAPFKCGPDYIDTSHLLSISGYPAYNLDTVFLTRKELRETFAENMCKADVGVIEGVMGLFDGIESTSFKASTYDIAKTLNLPVILVVDASKCSASIAALASGFELMAREIRIAGIIINNIGSIVHERLTVNALKNHSSLEILGVVPKNKDLTLKARHLGLVTAREQEKEKYEQIGEHIKKYVNVSKIIEVTRTTIKCKTHTISPLQNKKAVIAYDESFNFYYQNNLNMLEKMGYRLEFFSPLKNESIESADFVYLGGGYPELYAKTLSSNTDTLESLREHIDSNKPLIAECGGMMLLSKGIYDNDGSFYKMTGVFDTKVKMGKTRRALGYVKIKDMTKTFLKVPVFGHEFHYSYYTETKEPFNFELKKLTDGTTHKDGFIKNKTVASYAHFFFSEKFLKNLCGGVL